MAGAGGYQAPSNPAPASGPGALSQRTDRPQPARQLSDAAYGEQATFQQAQQAAPMSSTPGPDVSQGPSVEPPAAGVVPFTAPTQNPGQPVTAGADAGPGPGSASLGLPPNVGQADAEQLRKYLPAFELMANSPFASQATRQWYRQLRSMVPE